MAVDGGDVNLGGDITPEEMQMMMSMGIPFGFDTTQASTAAPNPVGVSVATAASCVRKP